MNIRQLLLKLLFRHTYSSEAYVNYIRNCGVSVGDDVKIFNPREVHIDLTRPYLLKIGNRVKITSEVIILTHDFSYSVFRSVYNDIQNECSGYTVIGDNCFLGMRSVIMPGVTLGKNCIVATGAVVTHSFPDGCVLAGSPAKKICTLDVLYERRKQRQVEDAFRLVNIIRNELHREPTISEMGSFYPLFLPRIEGILKKEGVRTKISGDVEKEIYETFYSTQPLFDGFEDFLNKAKLNKL